jgi:hypothetical protein
MIVGMAVLWLAASVYAQSGDTRGGDVLTHLRVDHPRLFVDKDTWDTIRAKRDTDPVFDARIGELEANAKALLDTDPVERKMTGRRMLSVSRTALYRIMLCSFIHQLNGGDEYLQRAVQEMHAVMAFEDWNPSHFLDVAEMAAAVSVGYDWLYNDLDPAFRAEVRAALWDKALKFPFDETTASKLWWMKSDNNWNSVCFGGLTMAMLATAEEHPERTAEWLEMVHDGNPHALKAYAPDGVYLEGPGYWTYGTTYQVILIAALESALGDDLGLSDAPGFMPTGQYPLQTVGPTGLSFNYADGGAGERLDPALFWFAKRTGNPSLALLERTRDWGRANSHSKRVQPLGAIWWAMLDHAGVSEINLPRYWHGNGEQPIAVFRSSWSDPDALYLATKGGRATINHGHMDAGSFVLDLGGVRWAADLGSQSYNSLESIGVNLWSKKPGSDRWTVFRINNLSHNTLTIDGKPHNVDGQATMIKFSDDPDAPGVTYDLSEVFADDTTSVVRKFRVESDHAVSVQDNLEGLRPGVEVRWAMLTPAEIELKGDTALLTQAGKTLKAELSEPAGAEFEWITADPPHDYDAPNPGYRLLIVKAEAPESGQLRIAVKLALE